jgi:uncharacterized protein YkwD
MRLPRPLTLASLALMLLLYPNPAVSHAADGADAVTVATPAAEPNGTELALFELTNQERARAGLAGLRFDPQALTVARARAAAQQAQSPLRHENAAGEYAVAPMLSASGLAFTLAGENLARVPSQLPDAAGRADQLLMNSPTHRANILEPAFDAVAIGTAMDADGRVVFAQVFRATI